MYRSYVLFNDWNTYSFLDSIRVTANFDYFGCNQSQETHVALSFIGRPKLKSTYSENKQEVNALQSIDLERIKVDVARNATMHNRKHEHCIPNARLFSRLVHVKLVLSAELMITFQAVDQVKVSGYDREPDTFMECDSDLAISVVSRDHDRHRQFHSIARGRIGAARNPIVAAIERQTAHETPSDPAGGGANSAAAEHMSAAS